MTRIEKLESYIAEIQEKLEDMANYDEDYWQTADDLTSQLRYLNQELEKAKQLEIV